MHAVRTVLDPATSWLPWMHALVTYSELEGSEQVLITVSLPIEAGFPGTHATSTNSPSSGIEQLTITVSDPVVLLSPGTQTEVTCSPFNGAEQSAKEVCFWVLYAEHVDSHNPVTYCPSPGLWQMIAFDCGASSGLYNCKERSHVDD